MYTLPMNGPSLTQYLRDQWLAQHHTTKNTQVKEYTKSEHSNKYQGSSCSLL